MEPQFKFTAVVALGIGGCASVLSVDEAVLPGWHGAGEKTEFVKNDIVETCEIDWFEYSLGLDVSKDPGVYRVTGGAFFTEDDAFYSDVKIERQVFELSAANATH